MCGEHGQGRKAKFAKIIFMNRELTSSFFFLQTPGSDYSVPLNSTSFYSTLRSISFFNDDKSPKGAFHRHGSEMLKTKKRESLLRAYACIISMHYSKDHAPKLRKQAEERFFWCSAGQAIMHENDPFCIKKVFGSRRKCSRCPRRSSITVVGEGT